MIYLRKLITRILNQISGPWRAKSAKLGAEFNAVVVILVSAGVLHVIDILFVNVFLLTFNLALLFTFELEVTSLEITR